MKLLIDGDGCPVIRQTVALARRYHLECLIFCDTAHRIDYPGAHTVIVDQGRDMVDFALVNRTEAGDIVITQDYGLAAMVLAKQAYAINQNGMRFTEENIDGLLSTRHINREQRRQGVFSGSSKKRTPKQDREFSRELSALLEEVLA